jgi:hypothetical protein
MDEVRARIRARHYSHRTEESYTQGIRRFIFFHNKRHSRQLGAPEVEVFLSGLATETFGAMRCAYCALPRFFL